MTQMSDPHAADRARYVRNALDLKRSFSLARSLHDIVALSAILATSATGCIIPPSLSVDVQDAAVNSPPAITAVRSDNEEVAEPGPLVFARNTTSNLDIALLDTDVDDVLYVRVFVDYTDVAPTAPRSLCSAPVSKNPERTATCPLNALCLPADIGQTRLMRIVVFDRPVLDVGMPAFMAMPPGGRLTSRTYQLKCTS